MTPIEFYKAIHNPDLYYSGKQEDLLFEIQLKDPSLELHQIIDIYQTWLQRSINGYYEFKTGKKPTTDRKTRKAFRRFMDKHNIMVRKADTPDNVNRWELTRGDEENPTLLTRLIVHTCGSSK